ncbi:MAG: protein-export chaperone SecB [Pseudomonadales bacterium]|nr:protein-export chaperone SecB [Pseudomonadales bacterium]
MAENESTNAAAENQAEQPQFGMQRIYIKDLSFESPRAPLAFQEKWAPQVKLDANTNASKVKDDMYEVVLTLTITVTNNDETAYLAEVQQAGVFSIKGLDGAAMEHTIGAFCPNILFPYAREAIDNLVVRGNFPPMHLAPINFDAIFAEAKKRRAEQADGEGKDQAGTTH